MFLKAGMAFADVDTTENLATGTVTVTLLHLGLMAGIGMSIR